MWLLRVVLILVGVAFVAGVYYYTKRHPPRGRGERAPRSEPTFRIDAPQRPVTRREPPPRPVHTATDAVDTSAVDMTEPESGPAFGAVEEGEARGTGRQAPGAGSTANEVVFSLALRLPGDGVDAARVLRELERLGLRLDERNIYSQDGSGGEAVFNVANLFEPGVLAPLPPDAALRGLSFFFMAEPSPATGGRFDRMLGTAYECARALGGRLEDMGHRPLTAARELELKLAAVGTRSE